MAQGSSVASTVRTVKYFDVRRDGDLVIMRVAADGFLYNMVRILCGTLVALSEGRIKENEIDAIIESRDRSKAGATLPPDGLCLTKVVYPENVFSLDYVGIGRRCDSELE
jgi:tRNA pseudouridine38-40 synthase